MAGTHAEPGWLNGDLETVGWIVNELARLGRAPGVGDFSPIARAVNEYLWRGGDVGLAKLRLQELLSGKLQRERFHQQLERPPSAVTADHVRHARALQLALSELKGSHQNTSASGRRKRSDTQLNEDLARLLHEKSGGELRFTSVQAATHEKHQLWAIAEVDPSPKELLLDPELGGTLYIGVRGTSTLKDLLDDLCIIPTAFDFDGCAHKGKKACHPRLQPHCCWLTHWTLCVAVAPGFVTRADLIACPEILHLAGYTTDAQVFDNLQSKARRNIVVCGHSLGGAIAQLVMLRLHMRLKHADSRLARSARLCCVTFGSPLVADDALAAAVEAAGDHRSDCILNIIGPADPVPMLLSQKCVKRTVTRWLKILPTEALVRRPCM